MEKDDLVLNNIGLIHKVIKDVNCYWYTEDEFQDFYDAGLIELVKSAKKYDGSVAESTFFYKCIKHGILHHMTIKNAKKRKIDNGILLSLDYLTDIEKEKTFLNFIEDEKVNVEKEVITNDEINRMMKIIDTKLKSRQKNIICHKFGLNGYKLMNSIELSKKYKCTPQAINDNIKYIEKKIKKHLNSKEMDIQETQENLEIKKISKTEKDRMIELIREKFSTENKKNIIKDETKEILNVINTKLKPIQKEIICQYLGINGYEKTTISELSRMYNCSRQNIFERINTITNKLAKNLIIEEIEITENIKINKGE